MVSEFQFPPVISSDVYISVLSLYIVYIMCLFYNIHNRVYLYKMFTVLSLF